MLAAVVRCLAGYALACVVAGAVQVASVLSPLDLLSNDSDRLAGAGIWLLLATLHTGIFALPFALFALAAAEWKSVRSLAYFEGVSFGIAILGFLVLTPARTSDQPIAVTLYLLAVCLTSGLSAGLVYWLIAGRYSGRRWRRRARI